MYSYLKFLVILFLLTFVESYSSLLSPPPQMLCGKPLQSGYCQENKLTSRYFFNTMNNSCQEYLGCDGPGNNFDSPSFCAAVCGASKIVKLNHDDVFRVKPLETCFKPKPTSHPSSVTPQLCDTKLRFYFNFENSVCHQFLYDEPCNKDGDFDETQINVFDSEEHCSTSCPSASSAILLPYS